MKKQRFSGATINPLRIIYNIAEQTALTEKQYRQNRENSTFRVFWSILGDILGAISIFALRLLVVSDCSAVSLKVTKIIPADVEQDLDNVKLREEFGKSIDILAENLAIAIAESKRWQSIEAISSEALDEAMEILEISELRIFLHLQEIRKRS